MKQKVKPSKKCLRCGRALTSKTSIKNGYGRICLQKIQQETADTNRFDQLENKIKYLENLIASMNKPGLLPPSFSKKLPPGNPKKNGSSIPVIAFNHDLNEIRANPVFLKYAKIADVGIMA